MAHNEEVKLHFLDYWRVIRIRWVLVLLAFLLVLITAAIFTYFQPREYKADVFVEVKSTAENPRIFSQGDPNQPIHDPQLAPTVFQVIQPDPIGNARIVVAQLEDGCRRRAVQEMDSPRRACAVDIESANPMAGSSAGSGIPEQSFRLSSARPTRAPTPDQRYAVFGG